jgi:hypothetical protein
MSVASMLLARADVSLGTVQVGGDTYHNVTVTSKSPQSVFIAHSLGFANIPVGELDTNALAKLGYNVQQVKLRYRKITSLADLVADPRIVAMTETFTSKKKGQMKGMERNLLMTAWCILLAGFMFFSYCCQQICEKAGTKPGLAVWIPLLQLSPLFRAAGMSTGWFFLILSPLLTPVVAVAVLQTVGPEFLWITLLPLVCHLVAYVVWSVKICRARGVGNLTALLLILPWTNLFAFLYLAFGAARNQVQQFQPQGVTINRSHASDTALFFQT